MNSKRISFITYLNVYASFAVVMLHNNGIVWQHPTRELGIVQYL